ncbi:MAG: hypothetical protein ACI855_005224 [Myxococcota bacterium]
MLQHPDRKGERGCRSLGAKSHGAVGENERGVARAEVVVQGKSVYVGRGDAAGEPHAVPAAKVPVNERCAVNFVECGPPTERNSFAGRVPPVCGGPFGAGLAEGRQALESKRIVWVRSVADGLELPIRNSAPAQRQ